MARKNKSRRPKQQPADAAAPAASTGSIADAKLIEVPPHTIGGIIMRLGPGLIIAGSIVGSGELIATTATGGQAGFWLLWLILIGCVIKVFVQVELGRYSIVTGQTTMSGLNSVPGPVVDLSLTGRARSRPVRGNWLVWFWFFMFMASLAQLGGIVGGVGQAMAISAPLTAGGQNYNVYAEAETELIVAQSEWEIYARNTNPDDESVKQGVARTIDEIYNSERDSNRHLLALKQLEADRAAQSTSSQARGDLSRIQGEIQANQAIEQFFQDQTAGAPLKTLIAHASLVLFNEAKLNQVQKKLEDAFKKKREALDLEQRAASLRDRLSGLRSSIKSLESELGTSVLAELRAARSCQRPPSPVDDKIWAMIITACTVLFLVLGRYGLIQSFSTAMVAAFTLVTIVNLVMLQSSKSWGISVHDIIDGMRFRLPPGNAYDSVAMALATFGIIGVGASELVSYPYWCIEKGYARFTGPRNASAEWAERARGWMRVMRWDAWCSMVIYTFATIAFYLLGAAILQPTQLDPKGSEMIRYLAVMYVPVFGQAAQIMFLIGAFAVLYSTFFVANASLARVLSDFLRVLHLAQDGDDSHRWRVRVLSGLLPIVCCSFYLTGFEPQRLVMFSGFMQATMLPMLAGAALYFRYYRGDERVAPGRVWDAFLWLTSVGMLIAGGCGAWIKIAGLLGY